MLMRWRSLSTVVVTVVIFLPAVAGAQSWEDRYRPAPACRVAVGLDTRTTNAVATSTGTLIVRPVQFEDAKPIRITRAILAGFGSASEQQWRVGFEQMDTSGVLEFRDIPAGRYLLRIGAIGYDGRRDTVAVRPGSVDTATVALEMFMTASATLTTAAPGDSGGRVNRRA